MPQWRHDSSTERIVSVKGDGDFHRSANSTDGSVSGGRSAIYRPPTLLPTIAGTGLKALPTYSLVPCILCRTRLYMANKMALIILDIATCN